MTEQSTAERLVIALALAGMLSAVGLMFNDRLLAEFFLRDQVSRSIQVGSVTRMDHDVRRRLAQNMVWLPLSQRSTIFSGDNIFTGSQSEAEISLDAGSKIWIGSNSLVVVSQQMGETNLDVNYGSVVGEIVENKPVVLKIAGTETRLKGNGAKVQIRTNGQNSDVSVLEGEVEVESGQTRSQLKRSEAVRLTDNGKAEIVHENVAAAPPPPPAPEKIGEIHLQQPNDQSSLWVNPQQTVEFKWNASSTETHFKIELARDLEFTQILKTEQVSAPTWVGQNWNESLTLYWRVSSTDHPQVVSQPWRLTLRRNFAPSLLEPEDEQIIMTGWDKKLEQVIKKPVVLTWQDETLASDFELELKEASGKMAVLHASVSNAKKYTTQPLVPGEYLWRVRASQSDRPDRPWSAEFHFTLKAPEPVKKWRLAESQQNVELQSHLGVKEMEAMSAEEIKLALVKAISNAPQFRWQTQRKAASYLIELANKTDGQFTKPIWSETTRETKAQWDQPQLGDFIWRVQALGKNKQPEIISESVDLHVTVAPPRRLRATLSTDRKPSAATKDGQRSVTLQWDRVAFADRFEIQTSSSADFTNPQTLKTDKSKLQTNVPASGSTYWRVRPLDGSGQPVGRYSMTAQVNDNAPDMKHIVQPLSPKMDSSIVFVGAGKAPILFKWSALEDVTEYRFELSATSHFKEVMAKDKTPNTKLLIEVDLPAGRYYWRVQGVHQNQLWPWTEPMAFQLRR